MNKKFLVIGNTEHYHNFEVGQVVTLVEVLDNETYEVEGKYIRGGLILQDVHIRDLEEIK